MRGQLVVRRALIAEVATVGRLTRQAYLADGLVDPAGPYVVALGDAARRARDAELLVATDPAGELLGTVTVCTPDSPLAEVSRPGELEFRMLAVAPQARHRGVGAALVGEVLTRAEQAAARRVVLSSSTRMRAAHRLYSRLGFVRLPERDWYPVPELLLLAFGRTREWHRVP